MNNININFGCIREFYFVAIENIKRLKPRLVSANSRNDISHRGYWNSVDIGFK